MVELTWNSPMSARDTHIAIFGDTHGHLRLMFQLCRLWQKNNGVHLDGILQVGDLGFFPDATRLDKATKRFARSDPEELGFADYFAIPRPLRKDRLLTRTLDGDPSSLDTVRCDVVFCHGNHEDFQLLSELTCGAVLSPVDFYNRIYYLRSGETADVAGVTVGAIGGAPESGDEKDHDESVLGPTISPRAVKRLRRKSCDVLMTHCAPQNVGGESTRFGSRLLRETVESLQPSYQVYGHHSRPILRATIGSTECVWLNDTNFGKTREERFNGPVEPGCVAVLRWRNQDDHQLTVVDDPWFRSTTGFNWRHV